MNYTLPGFHVSSLLDRNALIFSPQISSIILIGPLVPVTAPSSSPIVPPSRGQEIVLFCGYPALGKSSFYYRHFHPANYTHINQDILKTRGKCIKAVQEALKRGESCVVGTIDNTNRDIKTRRLYIDLARGEKVPIRQVKE